MMKTNKSKIILHILAKGAIGMQVGDIEQTVVYIFVIDMIKIFN